MVGLCNLSFLLIPTDDEESFIMLLNISASIVFLFQAVDILKTDYQPSDVDILYAEGVTSSNGLSCVDFSFPDSEDCDNLDSSDHPNSMLRYGKANYLYTSC